MARQILLIDGDQYLWRACAATERDVKWDDENHILASNEQEAWDTVDASLRMIGGHFNNTDLVVTLTDYTQPCFRYSIDATYKGNRKASRKPLCFSEIRERVEAEYKCVMFPGLEADDVMGILATKPGPDDKIIVSRDKDMKTIPGKLWNGVDFSVITEAAADRYHLYQTLIGDTADGYKGCPGVGPVKAEKIMAAAEDEPRHKEDAITYWPAVVAAYAKAGLTADDALRQARLARILRWSDWDSKKKEPILWSPPTTA
jgi:5'-3' exonuclease